MIVFGWPITRQLFFFGFLLATCFSAVVRGGRPEKIAAITLLVGAIFSVSVAQPLGERFADVEVGIFVIDALTLIVLLGIAIRSTRFWPLWLAAVLGAETAIHAMRLIVPGIVPVAYMNAQALWSWIAQLMLLIGTVRHVGRVRRYGGDPSWKPQFQKVAE